MNTFNKKSLYVALAATGLLGAGGVAQAVNLSDNGTGNVLVAPYYTVRATPAGNTYNTYINITNTTGSTKAVKVRFREAKNSAEVLDFNVFLSPFDMWTGAVVNAACVSGLDCGAAVLTADRSCTIPSFTFQSAALGSVSNQVPFRNLIYAGDKDGGGTSLDRTREGYVEFFEMSTYESASVVAINALHDATTGFPKDCNKVDDVVALAEAKGVSGGLMGSLQLINPGAGASMSVNMVALDNFYGIGPNTVGIYRTTGSDFPAMSDAGPTSAVVSGKEMTVSTGWGGNADAASAVLMHDSIMNEYVVETAALNRTDWVVTFPTKNFYSSVGSGAARAPFQSNFNPATGTACDDVTLSLWDREERNPRRPPGEGPDFSPKPDPTETPGAKICFEANVVTFNSGNVLATKLTPHLDINTSLDPGGVTDKAQFGWMRMAFTSTAAATTGLVNAATSKVSLATGVQTVAPGAGTYVGLPVVGFNVFSYTNTALNVGGVVSNVNTNYGMGFPHKSTTSILTPTP